VNGTTVTMTPCEHPLPSPRTPIRGPSDQNWIPDNASRFRDDSGNTLHVFLNGKEMRVATGMHHGELSESANSDSILSSPMPGTVTQVLIKEGDTVEAGQIVICIEAMKMEHSIKATGSATVKKLHVAVGDTTHENQELVELDFESTKQI
jgi:biotin carboxyl carrier protein